MKQAKQTKQMKNNKVMHQAIKQEFRLRNEKSDDSVVEFVHVPSFVFRDRSVAVLECLVEYLHDNKSLSFHEIAILLNRNDRTVWTVYHRAKLKRKEYGKGNNKKHDA